MCESYNRQYGRRYRSVMPTNLYGPNDNFHPENAHVLPALMRRVHEAKREGLAKVIVWGTGRAMREFLHVDDMARASVYVMEMDDAVYAANTRPDLSHINVGTGEDCTIRQLAEALARVIGYEGELAFDATKPDGTPRKLMDVSRLRAMGWRPEIALEDGLRQTYGWFLENPRDSAELSGPAVPRSVHRPSHSHRAPARGGDRPWPTGRPKTAQTRDGGSSCRASRTSTRTADFPRPTRISPASH